MEQNTSNENAGMEKFTGVEAVLMPSSPPPSPESGSPGARKFMVEDECPNLCNLMALRHVVDAGTVVKDIETGDGIDLCVMIERAEEEFRNMVRLLNI